VLKVQTRVEVGIGYLRLGEGMNLRRDVTQTTLLKFYNWSLRRKIISSRFSFSAYVIGPRYQNFKGTYR